MKPHIGHSIILTFYAHVYGGPEFLASMYEVAPNEELAHSAFSPHSGKKSSQTTVGELNFQNN